MASPAQSTIAKRPAKSSNRNLSASTKAEFLSADLTGRKALITVNFVSQLISATTNRRAK